VFELRIPHILNARLVGVTALESMAADNPDLPGALSICEKPGSQGAVLGFKQYALPTVGDRTVRGDDSAPLALAPVMNIRKG
jgi:hypothetical protein